MSSEEDFDAEAEAEFIADRAKLAAELGGYVLIEADAEAALKAGPFRLGEPFEDLGFDIEIQFAGVWRTIFTVDLSDEVRAGMIVEGPTARPHEESVEDAAVWGAIVTGTSFWIISGSSDG